MKIDNIFYEPSSVDSTLNLNKRFKYKNNLKKIEKIEKENPYLKYSKELQDFVKDLKSDNYHILSENFIHNIFYFYKIVNKKIFFTIIKVNPIYQNCFSYENDLFISNYIVNIIDIESINTAFNKMKITFNKSDKKINLTFFREYDDFGYEEPTKEQLKVLSAYKKTIYKNFINLNKKVNNVAKNDFINILSL